MENLNKMKSENLITPEIKRIRFDSNIDYYRLRIWDDQRSEEVRNGETQPITPPLWYEFKTANFCYNFITPSVRVSSIKYILFNPLELFPEESEKIGYGEHDEKQLKKNLKEKINTMVVFKSMIKALNSYSPYVFMKCSDDDIKLLKSLPIIIQNPEDFTESKFCSKEAFLAIMYKTHARVVE